MVHKGWPKGKPRGKLSPERAEKLRAASQSEAARANRAAFVQSAEGRERARRAAQALWANEDSRAELSAKRKALWQDPEYLAKQQIEAARRSGDPSTRARLRQIAGMGKGKAKTPEHAAKIATALSAYCARLTPEERAQRASRAADGAAAVATASNIERAVHAVLEGLGVEFIPQKRMGVWLVDFYLPRHKLVIECDGAYWHSLPKAIEKDQRKDHWLRSHHLDIVRLPEKAILQDAGACVTAALAVKGVLCERIDRIE